MWLNFALLFTVLAYIYPLKFLFTYAAGDAHSNVFATPYQDRDLVIVYGVGFAAVQLLFAALYGNAWRKRKSLHLSPLEITLTLSDFWNYIGTTSIGLLCCLLALLLPLAHASRAYYGFYLLILWGRTHAIISARHVRSARARTSPQDLEPFGQTPNPSDSHP
jgi:hypothetical protein